MDPTAGSAVFALRPLPSQGLVCAICEPALYAAN